MLIHNAIRTINAILKLNILKKTKLHKILSASCTQNTVVLSGSTFLILIQLIPINANSIVQTTENTFAGGNDALPLEAYSREMGAMGLPGDLSSASRFVRGAFVKLNSRCGEGEEESVAQFFHILNAVAQQRGCVRLGEGRYERTIYSCCCNIDRGIYYYNTYENCGLTAVELHRENLEGSGLAAYPMQTKLSVARQN